MLSISHENVGMHSRLGIRCVMTTSPVFQVVLGARSAQPSRTMAQLWCLNRFSSILGHLSVHTQFLLEISQQLHGCRHTAFVFSMAEPTHQRWFAKAPLSESILQRCAAYLCNVWTGNFIYIFSITSDCQIPSISDQSLLKMRCFCFNISQRGL